jgi:hypothetical protein
VLLDITVTERVTMFLMHIDNLNMVHTSHCTPQIRTSRSYHPHQSPFTKHPVHKLHRLCHSPLLTYFPLLYQQPQQYQPSKSHSIQQTYQRHALLQQPWHLASARGRKATPGLATQPNVPERLSKREPSTGTGRKAEASDKVKAGKAARDVSQAGCTVRL